MKALGRATWMFVAAAMAGCGGAASSGTSESAAVLQMRQQIDLAISRVYPALVRVQVVMTEPDDGRMEKHQGAGSGTIIHPDGYVVTNHHVAGKATRLTCRLATGEELDARLVGTDPMADIAVLKLDLAGRKDKAPLPVAKFADSDAVKVGDTVFAMGSPMAVSQSVTMGIVSNTQMIMPGMFWPMSFTLDGEDVGSLVRWIAHDAVIYGGNSGGPLVNNHGEIVGVNEIGLGSLGGAIPANLAKDVAEQIIRTGRVARSWIGLEGQPRLRGGKETRGVLVGGVIKDSPADKAGLKAGDVVLKFDGHAVDAALPEDLPLFNRRVLGTPVGKKVELVVLRGGKETTFAVTTIDRNLARGDDVELKSWGITVRDFTMLSALEKQRKNTAGVIVQTIRPGGPAGDAKPPMEDEDVITEVNGQPVKNVAELKACTAKLLEGKTSSVPVLVGFDRKEARMLTVVKVGKESEPENPELAPRPAFGAAVQVLTRELAQQMNLKGKTGVRITRLTPGGGAEKAGMKVGDILLKFDDEVIETSRPEQTDVFANMVRRRKIGAEVMVAILREGKPLDVKMTLQAPPKPVTHLPKYKDEDFEFTVRDLAVSDRMEQNLGDQVKGVLVEKVERAGWASLAHVAINDVLMSVDGQAVSSVADLEKVMKAVKQGKPKRVMFFVKRGIHTMYLELEPDWQKNGQ